MDIGIQSRIWKFNGQQAKMRQTIALIQNSNNVKNRIFRGAEVYQEELKEESRTKGKKKRYKQRRKIKKQQQSNSSKNKLRQIIKAIYQGHIYFEEKKNQIQLCLHYLKKKQKFYEFINDIIKEHVITLQDQIWLYMQSIINENPFETNDQNFYAQTVDKLFEIYQNLGKSSLEIENLIKFYMNSNQYTEQERPGLDQLTFSYMVQSEQNIKNLIKLCDQRMEQTVGQHREKLEIIVKMINFDEQEFYDEIEKQISEENFSLKQRKKKRKIKENELTTDPNEIIAKLDQLKIDNDRRDCQVSKGWLASIATKLSSCV